ncbi:MAG: ribosomal protein S3, partial [halophilic archaeon J07HX64]
MADEQQFIENGLQRTQIDEFFQDELGRAGYGGMEIAKTPMGTQIVLEAEKPGMVIGKGGKNIRKITSTLESEFNLEDPQVDVQEVDEPDLNARIVADRLANALERGWYFRKAGHTTIDRIMESGALGAEIVLSGKVTGARSRVEKFNRGYIKHNGEPAEEIVDYGVATAVMKLGTIGVRVRIIPPGAELPDDFEVRRDVEVEAYVPEDEGVEELLAGGADDGRGRRRARRGRRTRSGARF